MKRVLFFFMVILSLSSQASILSQDYSKQELERMGGEYMVTLYLFLDDLYCNVDEVRYPVVRSYCIQAYLSELLMIKNQTWADHFHKEASGLYIKPNIMEEGSPQVCEVTLEILSREKYNFNIYCDY